MENEGMNLFEAVTIAENAILHFRTTAGALELLQEAMADERSQTLEKIDSIVYAFTVILRDLQASIDSFEIDVDAIFKQAKEQREAQACASCK